MTRPVRPDDQFYDELQAAIGSERGVDGSPSAFDFLQYGFPEIAERLARDFEGSTLPTDDPGIRVYIGPGLVIPWVTIYVALDGDVVAPFSIRVDFDLLE